MHDTLMIWLTHLPRWTLALVAIAAAVVLHGGLRIVHLRLRRLEHGRWHLLNVAALAVHPPLVCLVWCYGAMVALYYLVPTVLGWQPTIMTLANVVGVFLGFWLFVRVSRRVIAVMDRWSQTRQGYFERFLAPFMARAAAALFPIFLLFSLFPLFVTSERFNLVIHNLTSMLLIGSIAGILVHGVNIGERALREHYRVDVADNLNARKVHTQIAVLRKIVNFLIVLVAVASMLMLFDKVRQLGTSILASAGIMGVVLGFAAQKIFGNLLAGVQIALTQPIQLDDAVVVQGEWGWIEELTLTYVVVRLWDWRRLVLPITWFLDNPFENWTRRTNDLIGSVMLYADFSLPLDALQEEATRIAQNSPLWSGVVCKVQLLEMTEYNMQLRVLVSARGGGDTFDLRCEMREGLIRFIAREYPDAFPRMRVMMPDRNSLHGEQDDRSAPEEAALTQTPEDVPSEDRAPNGPGPGS
ncbi:mechanosensitive ion channel family protein [Kushneria phyllosphaerae]|uniref:Miniconductance mechanosensitive channel MscM n=1 Tax=Kushneria phyllosphaerae TaxID=2100822 RepID=A0A2R8CGX1_9GAMM|nr:mechanosensitive ion channel domain-containing protein [Kushneria phyllosphaerae]SPJ32158.1 Miniconductance mechanosensitive channel MscM [Kushneria phyllosphaerae]